MKNLSKIRFLSSLLSLASLLSLFAAPAWGREGPHLLATLNREASQSDAQGVPSHFFALGGRLLFSTVAPGSLDQGILWSTDGTAHGTVQISTTICPGPCEAIVEVGAWHGMELLEILPKPDGPGVRFARTDGTPEGTFLLTGDSAGLYEDDAGPASVQASPRGDGFFFRACSYSYFSCALWHSDGTREGTGPFLGTDSLPFLEPHTFVAWRDRLYFVACRVRGDGAALWSTDGTPEGTRLVHEVQESPFSPFRPTQILATPSHLYFTAGAAGEDLWVTDGTAAGSRLLAGLQPPPCDPGCMSSGIGPLAAFGDEVYFSYRPPSGRTGIWRSDGTGPGTRRLVELPPRVLGAYGLTRVHGRWLFFAGSGDEDYPITTLWTVDDGFTRAAPLTGCPGGGCPRFVQPGFVLPSGDLLFSGQDGRGYELWSTDGTGPGSRPLTRPCTDLAGTAALVRGPRGGVYFHFCSPDGDFFNAPLWVTDGTPAGTYRVADRAPFYGFLGDLIFFGSTSTNGPTAELWMADGRPDSGRRVTTLRRYRPGSDPRFLPSGNGVLIAATPRTGEAGLWTSDGTRSGTLPLIDFPPHGASKVFGDFLGTLGTVQLMTVVRQDFENGYQETPELWRTDGTPQGTRLLRVFPAATYLDPQTAVVWNGRLLFAEEDSLGEGCSLWSTDGTPAGTRQIPWAQANCPSAMVPWGPQVLFFVWQGDTGPAATELFAGDGTPAGTRRIATLQGYADNRGLAPIGGTLFFDLITGEESQIWQTDGTGPGTQRASSLQEVSGFQIFRGALYFTAALSVEHEGGRGLFRIAPGGDPVLLARILHYSERTLYDPPSFAAAGDRLLFLFEEIESDAELWATDGTPAGTRRVRWFEQLPNQPFPDPENMVSAGGRAFFAASDGVHGRELWQSDGTPEGTRMVADLAPGGYSSIPAPSTLAITKNYLFFAADDGKTGVEPWALPLAP